MSKEQMSSRDSQEHGPAGATPSRRGFTIVEMLVAMTITLLLVLALVQAFEVVGRTVSSGRGLLEISGQLRRVRHRLHKDLSGVTAPTLPWINPDAGMGYVEYYEGMGIESTPELANTSLGDFDDVLMFTSRSKQDPFVGQYVDGGTTKSIQSELAEIVWFANYIDQDGDDVAGPGEVTLYRRALLVNPTDVGTGDVVSGSLVSYMHPNTAAGAEAMATDLRTFFNSNDISVRMQISLANNNVTIVLIANTLADLSRRENRYCHRRVIIESPAGSGNYAFNFSRASFPYPLDVDAVTATDRSVTSIQSLILSSTRLGEDVMLSDVLGFDLKAFDPTARIRTVAGGAALPDGTQAIIPDDPGWDNTATNIGSGAFVNLNYGSRLKNFFPPSYFSGVPPFHDVDGDGSWDTNEPFFGLVTDPTSIWDTGATWDTWPSHYEHDGNDQDDRSGFPTWRRNNIDQGNNGLDDDGENGVDDAGERETKPPYPVPLRGLQASIRVIEPDSRQVRQVTVVTDFMPE